MGYTLSGHGLVVLRKDAWYLPTSACSMNYSTLKQELCQHVNRTVQLYKNYVSYWEIGEPLWKHSYEFRFSKEQLIDIYKAASKAIRAADPEAKIIVNMLPITKPSINYYPVTICSELIDAGLDFDIIGIEYYYDLMDMPLSELSYWLDAFSRLGKPIFLSEIGVSSAFGEQHQADRLRNIYELAFSKEYVKSVTWYFITDDPFYPGAGLLREPDFGPRQAFNTLKDLISQWTTKGSGITDTNGYLRFQGYAGNYSITATTHEGLTQSFQLHVQERESNPSILRFDRAGQIALVASLLSRAEKALGWAKGVGKEFDTLKVDRMLADAKSAFNSSDYGKAKTIADALLEIVSMKMDGSDADWKGIREIVTDVSGDAKAEGTDVLGVFGVMDNEYLYLMMRISGRINKEGAFVFDIDNDGKNEYAVRLHNDYTRLWLRPRDETISESLEYGWGDIIEVKVPLRLMQNPATIKVRALSIISNKLSRDTGLSDQTDWGQIMVARMTTEVTGTLTKTTTVDWMQTNTLILCLFAVAAALFLSMKLGMRRRKRSKHAAGVAKVRMSAQNKRKLLAVLVAASAILGVVGWQQFTPQPTPPRTVTITPAVTTVSGTQTSVALSKTTVPPQIEWIRVGEVRPVSHYVSLLESNGTQPYVQLAKELRKLPDLTNATAVAKITYLALNATNPEVKEAFELLMKGGAPDPRDYKYSVPNYNTELQVLYWLACQNEFKKDDTLALAIAMVNGLWVTIGEEQIAEAVKRDSSELLVFYRETDQLQKENGYFRLENLPLEAKTCLAWTGGYSTSGGRPYSLKRYTKTWTKLPLKGYLWDTVSVETLKKMRDFLKTGYFVETNVDRTVATVERYFYFGTGRRWTYTGNAENTMMVDGEEVVNHDMNNVDFEFRYYLENGKGIGDCGDESGLIDGFCKSWGIASTYVMHQSYDSEMTQIVWSHMKVSYYEPVSKTWRICEDQLNIGINEPYQFTLMVYRPPVIQPDYLNYRPDPPFRFREYGNMCYIPPTRLTAREIKDMFSLGVATSKVKQWLLYS
jgi:hypothetical protein